MSEPRFRYYHCDGIDICPPHSVWDTVENVPATGSFSTKAEAECVAYGMNKGFEVAERKYYYVLREAKALAKALVPLTNQQRVEP
jgi:hypothetical protein